MAEVAASETPLLPRTQRGPAEVAAGRAQRWRPLLVVLACAVLALALLAHGWNLLRLHAALDADAELIEAAGAQRARAEQIGRLAALVAADAAGRRQHAEALRVLLDSAAEAASALDERLAREQALDAGQNASAAQALQAWRAGSENLWRHGRELLRRSETPDGANLQPAMLAVQAETTAVQVAAHRVLAALRSEAVRHDARHRNQDLLGLLLGAAFLLLLGLTLLEPTARAVRRQAARLQEQAAELQRLALVAEHTAALVLITDPDDRIVWVNDAFSRVAGWPLADARGLRPGDLLASPHADPEVLARVQQAVRRGRGARHEWLHRTRDGRDLWLDVDMRPLHGDDGELSGFVRVATDVTGRVQQQGKLQALWKGLPAGVVVHDAKGEIVEANRAAEQLLGRPLAELLGRDAFDPGWRALREDGSDYPAQELPVTRTLASGEPLRNQTLGIRTPQGELRWLLLNTEPLFDAQGQISGVLSCFGDATESRRLNERLTSSARTDALTHLPNRAVVMERLQRAIDHGRRHPGYGFAVLFMDFDRFKQVNDTLGHGAGDELLRQVAERLLCALRPGDAVARLDDGSRVAARIGGDEFVVVLEGVHDAQTVGVIADRLLADLSEPYVLGSTPVQSGVSLGVVLARGGEGTADEVLRNADTAMYEAKRAGRGRWVMFDDSMHERVVRALAVENDLRSALKADELFVIYQPVVDLATRSPVGVEALVRWRHPSRGLVPPVEFIGIAEESGLIDAVGSFVLRTACLHFVRWHGELGALAPRHLAVNLSRAQLKRGDLVHEVRDLLQETAMRPEQLQLEITESLAAQDEQVQATLRGLKSLGVKLALDDFGTGYSSLACLHQMPVDTVKVDRSFVRHAETVEYHRVLIEATIRVARALGMTTVAEGIETEGQAALMLALECDLGQGFLYARPLEAGDYEAWVRLERTAALPA
jgi:diguanylate cyclase (GGDEF)-like protein/PAS domain S-box-containing protein